MRKAFCLVLTLFLSVFIFAGCDKEETEEIPVSEVSIEQVVDAEVSDYNVLNVNQLELLAYEGDVDAQYQLGVTYEYGDLGQQQNFDKAIEWYTMAASYDNKDAVCALGYFYLNGCGVEKDIDLAGEYFSRAIALGSVNAHTGMGRVYLAKADALREQISQTEEEAEDAEESKAVDQQEIKNQINVFEQEARRYIEKAHLWGDVDGTYYMGYLFENGIGCMANNDKAASFYRAAASKEIKDNTKSFAINEACVSLSLLYIYKDSPEYETAIEYLTKASESGYAPAQFYLGQLYENGLGVKKDYEEALKYYLMACEKEYAPALNQVGYFYYNGYGVQTDFATVIYYQKLAAMQGYAPAQVNLGYMYEYGYGVECNLETAKAYYQLAADAGYEGAQDAVIRVTAQINEEN